MNTKCTCGKPKARRYKVCSTCYDKMPVGEKDGFRSVSEKHKQGTLRRWQ